MKLENDEDFKAIPGLRWKLDSDGCPIAKTIRTRIATDHLFFWGKGKLGIYYRRWTRTAASRARKWWLSQLGGEIDTSNSQIGDTDGTIIFAPTCKADLPEIFFKRRSNGVENRERDYSTGRLMPKRSKMGLGSSASTSGDLA